MDNHFRRQCLSHLPGESSEGRCLIIGEVAQSHDGSLGMAHSFIEAIANAGADAVKFQTHIAAEESTRAEPWRVQFSKQDASRYDYWKRMEFTADQWLGLKQHADDRGILFMSSPFSASAVDLLAAIGMRIWKVASGEVSNLPLLGKIVSTCDPVILSSGMSDLAELDAAVAVIKESGNPIAILQCATAYPCPPEQVGLNVLHEFRRRYAIPVGLSDHSGNIFAGLAAVTLGADVLEIHVTLSREMFGPDVPASVTTHEFRQMIDGVRQIERMSASPANKEVLSDNVVKLRNLFTKSIVASKDLPAGTVLELEHVRLKKPGTGLDSTHLPDMIGRKLRREMKTDEFVLLQDVEM